MLHRILRLIYDFRSRGDREPIPWDNFAKLERDFARKLGLSTFDWVAKDTYSPMHLPDKPLRECRVALVSTAGVYEPGQKPFALRLAGDDSYRVIDGNRPVSELRVRHGGYDSRRAREDLNCVFPLDRLHELVSAGRVGEVARHHLSFMGYVPSPVRLEREKAPEAGRLLLDDGVDLVLLSPA